METEACLWNLLQVHSITRLKRSFQPGLAQQGPKRDRSSRQTCVQKWRLDNLWGISEGDREGVEMGSPNTATPHTEDGRQNFTDTNR